MRRYIALAWNIEDSSLAALVDVLGRRIRDARPGWEVALRSSGLNVYCSGPSNGFHIYRLAHDRGAILGTLFRRNATQNSSVDMCYFDEIETDTVCNSHVRHLVERFWGRYVAFVKRTNLPGTWIFRDPAGGLPCFMTKCGGIDIVFSDVEDCANLGLVAGSINWDHIASYLWFDRIVASHTGLSDVCQIHAGERIVAGTHYRSITDLWNPVEICGQRTIENRAEASEELGATIQSSVASWASCYDSILLELSGGLDSSVVLACLSGMRNAPGVVCENHFTRDPAGDERFFARQAAASAGVELIETPINPSDHPLESMFDRERVATPTLMLFVPEALTCREEIIRRLSIDVVFSGQGGDHLFQSVKTRQIAAEYASRHGFGKDLLRVVNDTSRLTRTSFWAVVWTVITSGLLHRSADPYDSVKPSFLLSEATRAALNPDDIRHKWVDFAESLPACKQRQIFDIIDTQNFQQVPRMGPDAVHPLISQPIIEICLQIPSYTLSYHGVDRALVRDTFVGMVPVDVATRVTKGTTTGYFSNLLARNAPFLRDVLLGGSLMAEGLLNKQRMESVLSESSLIRGSDLLFPVLDAVRAELWLRSWASLNHRLAA